MTKSKSIRNIAKALLAFDSEVARINKTAENPMLRNRYAPLSEILDSIKDPLLKSGLTVKQFPSGEHELTTLIIHAESGEFLESTYQMKPTINDPQGEGSRITYQRRYALGAALGLNIEEDDDGNKASRQKKVKVGNKKPEINKEEERIIFLIQDCTTLPELYKLFSYTKDNANIKNAFDIKSKEITKIKDHGKV